MANAYQQWNQSQVNFGSLQLEQEFDFSSISNDQQQQQHQQHIQQQPQNYHSSSLHGALAAHSTPSAQPNLEYIQGVYSSQINSSPPSSAPPYRSNFNFSSMPAFDSRSAPALASSHPIPSPAAVQSSLPSTSRPYYPEKQVKRQHTAAFKDDINLDDPDGELTDQNLNKSKLSRACARCKNLKVRCEAKTETEPCKRCFNGGHECVIPGRKIRRTPPKREHLLGQIQSQAKEIERLMLELEKYSSKQSRNPDHIDTSVSSNLLHPPVLTPNSYFANDPSNNVNGDNNPISSGSNANNPDVNKAVEDWIAKARESLHEFGAFIGVGGATMPKSYLMQEDFENNSSSDEYGDGEDLDDDHYELAVEDPSGETTTAGSPYLTHKKSSSSVGTPGTTNARKKILNENARPANLPVEASPFGLFGNLSLKNPGSRSGSAEPEEDDKGSGIANANFFRSTTAPHALGRRLENAQHQAPAILTRGIISPQEAEKLFKIYFDNINLSLSLLDPVLYTAQRTFYRSPFLFTVICAISSRFYSERSDLYPKLMHYAQLAAGTALISGNKNVEMCSAYIILSLYPVPTRKWEDQRGWLYLGLAIRTATDLNLHLPTTAKPLNENHAREMLNRTRIWMNCLNLDRSTGSQYGKPPIISPKDYIANHSENWWASSEFNMKNFDIHICAYNSELKVMAAFIAKIYTDPDHPTGLNKEVDFERIATETDDELKILFDKWFTVLAQTDQTDTHNVFRTGLLRLAYSYSRLIALSYGFQHAFGKNDGIDENPFLMRCLAAASDVVNAVVNDICRPGQVHFFRHGPEAQSVFVTFASAFLVKLLQPKFASYLDLDQRFSIRALVQKVINLLGSPEVAIDERHGPKLYSRFLEKLLAKPMARIDLASPPQSPYAPLPRSSSSPNTTNTNKPRKVKLPDATPSSSDIGNVSSAAYGSPATSTSLSPPPTETALSFEHFAPVGAIDPFTPVNLANPADVHTLGGAGGLNMENALMGVAGGGSGFFQPSLPFDDHIMQSVQSLTDPNGWQDIPLPGFNWMTQFQQNLGLDLNNPYDQNMDYMTGHANSI